MKLMQLITIKYFNRLTALIITNNFIFIIKYNIVGGRAMFGLQGEYRLGAYWIGWGGIGPDFGHLLAIRPIRECVLMCLLCVVVGGSGAERND